MCQRVMRGLERHGALDSRPPQVEDHISSDGGLGSLGLEDGGALLLPYTNLTEEIAADHSPSREDATGPVDSESTALGQLICPAPQGNRRGPQPGKVGVSDTGIAV